MAATKRSKKPEFTVQVRATIIFDVTVQDGTLTEAIELGKHWKRPDLITGLDDAVAVADESYTVVGAWGDRAFSVSD